MMGCLIGGLLGFCVDEIKRAHYIEQLRKAKICGRGTVKPLRRNPLQQNESHWNGEEEPSTICVHAAQPFHAFVSGVIQNATEQRISSLFKRHS